METAATPLRGKTVLITGATSGIGLVTARELARQGARVVLVGRSRQKCDAALAQIQSQTGNREAEALLADLSEQQEVRDLARQFLEHHDRLDVLVNNAGGMWLERRLTADGLEMTFAVNHLAYFLLTDLLQGALRAAAPARVVNVSSEAHRRDTLDFDNLQGERGYGGWRQYCRSKLMNLLFTYELARRLDGSGVTANALHPGWVSTGFGGGNGWRGRLLQAAAGLFALSPERGARTTVYLASAPEVATVSGRYFVKERAVQSSPASCDEPAAQHLWLLSERLTGLASQPRAV